MNLICDSFNQVITRISLDWIELSIFSLLFNVYRYLSHTRQSDITPTNNAFQLWNFALQVFISLLDLNIILILSRIFFFSIYRMTKGNNWNLNISYATLPCKPSKYNYQIYIKYFNDLEKPPIQSELTPN